MRKISAGWCDCLLSKFYLIWKQCRMNSQRKIHTGVSERAEQCCRSVLQLWWLTDLRTGFMHVWLKLWERRRKLLKQSEQLKRPWSSTAFCLSETFSVTRPQWGFIILAGASAALGPAGLLIKASLPHETGPVRPQHHSVLLFIVTQ